MCIWGGGVSGFDFTDEQIVTAIDGGNAGPGGRADHILRRLGVNYAKPDPRLRKLYQRLCKLENMGRVYRDARRSYVNSIFWMTGPKPRATSTPNPQRAKDAGGQG